MVEDNGVRRQVMCNPGRPSPRSPSLPLSKAAAEISGEAGAPSHSMLASDVLSVYSDTIIIMTMTVLG